jgi:peptidoglycan hydrolase CwlO-like protein
MKKLFLLFAIVTITLASFAQDPISNLKDESRNKIELNDKSIKNEKAEIEKHQNSLSNFQSENSKLKKLLKITPTLSLNSETKDNAVDDIKNKITNNDNFIKNEKMEIEKHQKNLAELQKENRSLKEAVKKIKKL